MNHSGATFSLMPPIAGETPFNLVQQNYIIKFFDNFFYDFK